MSAVPSAPQRQSLKFCKAFFEIVDGPGTHGALEEAGAVLLVGSEEPGADRWYRWDLVEGEDRPIVSFLLRTTAARLVLEGPTPASVGRGWRALEQTLEPFARARVAAGDDLARFLPKPRKHSADRPESWNKEHEGQVLREFYQAFVRRWAHQPDVRLGGLTPVQAAADSHYATVLEGLLERMARVEEERAARGMPGVSVDRLCAALVRT